MCVVHNLCCKLLGFLKQMNPYPYILWNYIRICKSLHCTTVRTNTDQLYSVVA